MMIRNEVAKEQKRIWAKFMHVFEMDEGLSYSENITLEERIRASLFDAT